MFWSRARKAGEGGRSRKTGKKSEEIEGEGGREKGKGGRRRKAKKG